jgi:hypothetical protein
MPDFQSSQGLPLLPIEHPRCLRCSARMTLTGVQEGPKGYDLRMFECVKCTYTHVVRVETDPMKSSGAMKWVASDLKPPR